MGSDLCFEKKNEIQDRINKCMDICAVIRHCEKIRQELEVDGVNLTNSN